MYFWCSLLFAGSHSSAERRVSSNGELKSVTWTLVCSRSNRLHYSLIPPSVCFFLCKLKRSKISTSLGWQPHIRCTFFQSLAKSDQLWSFLYCFQNKSFVFFDRSGTALVNPFVQKPVQWEWWVHQPIRYVVYKWMFWCFVVYLYVPVNFVLCVLLCVTIILGCVHSSAC